MYFFSSYVTLPYTDMMGVKENHRPRRAKIALDSSDASRRHQPRPQGTTGEGDVVSGHIGAA